MGVEAVQSDHNGHAVIVARWAFTNIRSSIAKWCGSSTSLTQLDVPPGGGRCSSTRLYQLSVRCSSARMWPQPGRRYCLWDSFRPSSLGVVKGRGGLPQSLPTACSGRRHRTCAGGRAGGEVRFLGPWLARRWEQGTIRAVAFGLLMGPVPPQGPQAAGTKPAARPGALELSVCAHCVSDVGRVRAAPHAAGHGKGIRQQESL